MRLPLREIALLGILLTAAVAPVRAGGAADPVAAARARELVDDPAGAAAHLQAYVDGHPDDAAAGRLLGDLAFRIPDVRRAETVWLAVVRLHPADVETRLRLGALYAAQGRVRDAIEQDGAAMPNTAAAVALVRLHALEGDLQTFLDDVAADADRNRFDPDRLLAEATVLQAAHEPAEALGFYTRVVDLRRGRCLDVVARAVDLLDLHRSADAIADLGRCLDDVPSSYEAMVAMGGAYLAENDVANARGWYERALLVDPTGFDALVDRGYLEDAAGQWQAAMRDDQAAIAAEPMRSEGYANLAYDLMSRHALTAAGSTVDAGLRAAPADGRLHYLRARLFELEGKPAGATRAEYVAALGSDEETVVNAARRALQTLDARR